MLSISCEFTDLVEEELVRLRSVVIVVLMGDIFDDRGQVVKDGARRCGLAECEDDESAVQHPTCLV